MEASRPGSDIVQSGGPEFAPPTDNAPMRKSSDERKSMLAREVANISVQGYRIESQSDFQAVAVKGKSVNHVAHGIASLLTLGIWLIPWLIFALVGGEKRELVQVDEWGNISRQKL